ncbi:MAG: DedA family protein [Rubrobacteraceae bacterium]
MSIDALVSLLEAHPYLLLFPLVMVEGPLATICAGVLVSAGLARWAPAFILVVAADLAGDTLYYLLGRSGRRPGASRLLARLGLDEERLATLEESFDRNGAKALAGAKIADFAAIPTLAAAGLLGMNYKRFLAWDLAVTIPKSAALIALGFFFGQQALHFADYLDVGSAAFLALIPVAVVVAFFVVSRRVPRKERSKQETEDCE